MSIIPDHYKEIRKLADALIASHGDDCSELLDQVEALTLEDAQLLDTMALECTSCNHWFCVGEIGVNAETAEYVCYDCSEE